MVGDQVLCHAGLALERHEPEGDATRFLYPSPEEHATAPNELETVLADVAASTRRKCAQVIELRRAVDVGC